MTRLISTTALMLILATPALAHREHHARFHHRHHYANRFVMARGSSHRSHRQADFHGNAISRIKLVEEETAAGTIKVDQAYAERFKELIADFAAAGYHMTRVHCWAPVGTHVRHSRHYLGQACDFNQTGWGKTDRFMYTREAAAIIEKHGFTNGCRFRDCGHVGTDGQGGSRYATRKRIHYAHHGRRYAGA